VPLIFLSIQMNAGIMPCNRPLQLIRSECFTVTEWNEVFSGEQPRENEYPAIRRLSLPPSSDMMMTDHP
jgi:hypothetical protein